MNYYAQFVEYLMNFSTERMIIQKSERTMLFIGLAIYMCI